MLNAQRRHIAPCKRPMRFWPAPAASGLTSLESCARSASGRRMTEAEARAVELGESQLS